MNAFFARQHRGTQVSVVVQCDWRDGATEASSMPVGATMGCGDRAFPSAQWRDYLRTFQVNWARTRHTDDVPTWYAIEGKGYVVWVSDPQLIGDRWRISLAVSASVAPPGLAIVEEIVRFAL